MKTIYYSSKRSEFKVLALKNFLINWATRQKLDGLVYQVFSNRIKINPVNPVKK